MKWTLSHSSITVDYTLGESVLDFVYPPTVMNETEIRTERTQQPGVDRGID